MSRKKIDNILGRCVLAILQQKFSQLQIVTILKTDGISISQKII